MATLPDVEIIIGEDTVIKVTVYDQDNVIKPVTGATVSFRMGDRRVSEYHFAKAGFVDDGPNGVIGVDILNSDSSAFLPRTWDYQFVVTDGDGDVQVVKEGLVNVVRLLPATP